ncbi:unnamed protein product [Closterium sp. NIES-54]
MGNCSLFFPPRLIEAAACDSHRFLSLTAPHCTSPHRTHHPSFFRLSQQGGSHVAGVSDCHWQQRCKLPPPSSSVLPSPHCTAPHLLQVVPLRPGFVIPIAGLVVVPLRPGFVIPIAGLVVGGSMTIAANTMQRLADDFQQRRGEVEAALALGASQWQASLPLIRKAVAVGFGPTLDYIKTYGVIQLPGAMRLARARAHLPCPARAARACPARVQVPPAAAALGTAATRVRCPALPCPALAAPCPECCYAATATCATAAAQLFLPAATACHYHCPTPGGGASRARAGGAGASGPRTRRRETLSSHQLRKRAVWWGSPGGGAWCATTGGPCESTPTGSTAGRRGGSGGGQQQQQRPPETLSPQQLREWAVRWGSPGGGGFRSTRNGGVEAPGGVEAASLGAFDSANTGAELEEALHTFTLDSGASRCSSATAPQSHRSQCMSLSHWPTPPGARPGSGLYTLTTEFALVAESGQVAASVEVAASCWCRLLMHQTLLLHHRLGHPSLPCLRGMHSRLLVSGLPRSLPPLPRSLAPPCLPCVEGRQRATPHSSLFPPTTAPLQTLHMDMWGPARVTGQGGERYFLIHAAAPHFLWPFAVRNATAQLNLWPRVSHPETSPTFQWTGKVGDASAFRVWGSLSLIRDLPAGKLSPRTLRCVFLGFPADTPPWQFYHPGSRRVLSSRDVTFDEFVCFYRLHPHRSSPVPLLPLSLVDEPPPVAPLAPLDPPPSSVSQRLATGGTGGAGPVGASAVVPRVGGTGGAGTGGAIGGTGVGGAIRHESLSP